MKDRSSLSDLGGMYEQFYENWSCREVIEDISAMAESKQCSVVVNSIVNGRLTEIPETGDEASTDLFTPVQGTWTVKPLCYTGVPAPFEDTAISIADYAFQSDAFFIDLEVALETSITFSDNTNGKAGGLLGV